MRDYSELMYESHRVYFFASVVARRIMHCH